MRYLGGAPLELPLPADPGIILFLFFSSASATTFIILSWSMVALANSLYDKLVEYTTVPLLKVQELLQLTVEQTCR
jgi:hypothetical protein